MRGPDPIETPHGRCVVVEFADDDAITAALARLPGEEQARATALGAIRRRELICGRTALHHALADFAPAILADERGAPVLPAGWVGSISHKGAVAAALVAPAGDGWVGVDLERAAPPRQDIGRRILTAREQAALAGGDPSRITLAFAIKEAIYKAIDPTLRRYVGFTEVELALAGDGGCAVTSALPLAIDAAWRLHAGYWLATARARPR